MIIKNQKVNRFIILIIVMVLLFTISLQINFAADMEIGPSDTNGIDGFLIQANSGDTLNLTNGTYTGENNTNIIINKSIIIIGTGSNVIIDAQGLSRIFTINNTTNTNINVNFTNITFINGNSVDGGAIDIYGANVTFTNCTFTNNSATYGGAIHNLNGNITLTGCTFTKNTATSYGGVIYNRPKGTLTAYNCTFTNNSATYGGAVYNQNRANLTGCIFTGNTATNRGGAIYNNYGGNLTVNYSVFCNNTANDHIIYIDPDTICSLKDNFYFWINLNNMNALLNNLTNNRTTVQGFYYLNITNNTASFVGDTLNIKSLLAHSASSSVSSLPDLNIILKYNGREIRNYSYKTETDVQEIVNNVANSVQFYYETYLIHELTFTVLDYSNLEVAIINTNGLSGNSYTTASWDDLQIVLTSAIAMSIAKDASSQTDIDALTLKLNNAIVGLVLASKPTTRINPTTPTQPTTYTIPAKTMSSLNPVLNVAKGYGYVVGEIATISWSVNGIANLNQMITITFLEDGKVQHVANVLLKEGSYNHEFIKSHKNLDIVLSTAGDKLTIPTFVDDINSRRTFVEIKKVNKLKVAKKGNIEVVVRNYKGNIIQSGKVTLKFDNKWSFTVAIVNGIAKFSKTFLKAGNNRSLKISYMKKENNIASSISTKIVVNKRNT